MIFLRRIRLANFKGVAELSCDFDDLTLLAGLNNAGKTSVLQAVYLIAAILPAVLRNGDRYSPHRGNRVLGLSDHLPWLGVTSPDWLRPGGSLDSSATVIAEFANGLVVELEIDRNGTALFTLTRLDSVSEPDFRRQAEANLAAASAYGAELVAPPGETPSREEWLPYDSYVQQVQRGQRARVWRNQLYWQIEEHGPESFAPVRARISKYFPDVKLMPPRQSLTGPTTILIEYEENGARFDIAQSGAGLRAFLTLSQLLETSQKKILLLDEPDAHLHASHQRVLADLLLDAAEAGRQVILTSHSPELIRCVPMASVRWVERNCKTAEGGQDFARVLERLGVTAGELGDRGSIPETLVFVEGPTDKEIVDAVILWCRAKHGPLPGTLVVSHSHGRFEPATLQGIASVLLGTRQGNRVVGIRDLDWAYGSDRDELPSVEHGDRWSLLTLPVKEIENLFCDEDFLIHAAHGEFTREEIAAIIDETSNRSELLNEWRHNTAERIRKSLGTGLAPVSKESRYNEIFDGWARNPSDRRRYVAGKELLQRILEQMRSRTRRNCMPRRVIASLPALTPLLQQIAGLIFPGLPASSGENCSLPPDGSLSRSDHEAAGQDP